MNLELQRNLAQLHRLEMLAQAAAHHRVRPQAPPRSSGAWLEAALTRLTQILGAWALSPHRGGSLG